MIERFMTGSEIKQNEYIIINNSICRTINDEYCNYTGNRYIDNKINSKKFINKEYKKHIPKKKEEKIKFSYNL
jgi:hypothetical protein